MQRNPVFRQRIFIAGKAFNPGRRIQRAGDKRDITMAAGNQFFDRRKRRGFLIGPDAMAGVAPQAAVEHHNRLRLVFYDFIHFINAEKTRIDDNGIAAQVEQVLDRLALFFRAVLAVGQNQLPSLVFRHPRNVKQQLAKIDPVIKGVGYHQPQRLALFGSQITRQQIGPVAAFRYGLKYAIFRFLADIAVARQYPGNGRLRYSRAFRHLQHRCHVVLPVAKDARSVLHASPFYSFDSRAAQILFHFT